jgi:hypothetical protein
MHRSLRYKEEEQERADERVSRPIYITLISSYLILLALYYLYHLYDSTNPELARVVRASQLSPTIHYNVLVAASLINILSALLMMRGKELGRTLFVLYTASAIVWLFFDTQGNKQMILPNIAIFSLISLFLFSSRSNEYFCVDVNQNSAIRFVKGFLLGSAFIAVGLSGFFYYKQYHDVTIIEKILSQTGKQYREFEILKHTTMRPFCNDEPETRHIVDIVGKLRNGVSFEAHVQYPDSKEIQKSGLDYRSQDGRRYRNGILVGYDVVRTYDDQWSLEKGNNLKKQIGGYFIPQTKSEK